SFHPHHCRLRFSAARPFVSPPCPSTPRFLPTSTHVVHPRRADIQCILLNVPLPRILMGFFSGRLSFTRFRVEGASPGNFGPEHLERLQAYQVGKQRVSA